MKLINEGHKEDGFCKSCKEIVPTVFVYKDFILDKSTKPIQNVLQSVCKKCDSTVALPPQSMPKIRPFLNKPKGKSFRIPRVIEDVIYNIASKYHLQSHLNLSNTGSLILKFYLKNIVRKRFENKVFSNKYFNDETFDNKLFFGNSKSRLPLYWSDSFTTQLEELSEKHQINSSVMVKYLFMMSKFHLLDEINENITNEFKDSTRLLQID